MGCPANFSMLYLQSKNSINERCDFKGFDVVINEWEMPISEMCELSSLYCFSFLKPELISSLLREMWWHESSVGGVKRRVSIFPESQYPDTSYRHVWKPSALILLIRGYYVNVLLSNIKTGNGWIFSWLSDRQHFFGNKIVMG